MEVDKNEWRVLKRAIAAWQEQGTIDAAKANELRKTINLKRADRQQIAQYFFIVAISCTILAFGALFIDDKFLEKLKAYFDLGNLVIAFGCTLLGALWFWYVRRRYRNYGSFSYEVYMVLGALLLLSALVYFCKDFGFGPERLSFFAVSGILLFGLGYYFRSRLLWLSGIVALVACFGALTTWLSDGNLFLKMNFPMRYVVFGLLITGASFLLARFPRFDYVQRLTYLSGLFLFFISFWMVSIFGNYGHLDEWAKVRQVQVILYAVAFGLISALVFYLGIKYKDATTRDVAVLFLLLNLYSRYFEYFWDSTNKGIFFLILAVSFWFTGRFIEKRRKLQKSKLAP